MGLPLLPSMALRQAGELMLNLTSLSTYYSGGQHIE
jgi:hypothetical protein